MKVWDETGLCWIEVESIWDGKGSMPHERLSSEGWRQKEAPLMLRDAPGAGGWPTTGEGKAPTAGVRPTRGYVREVKAKKRCAGTNCVAVVRRCSTYCMKCYAAVRVPPMGRASRCACGRVKERGREFCERCRFRLREVA